MMATARGFVQSIEVRDDGVVEFILQAVHAGNTGQVFFIEDVDGVFEKTHRRLAQLSLIRDAVARVLPVEVDYDAQENKGNVVLNLTVRPRPSLDGRQASRRVQGVVIGVSLFELGPSAGVVPYRDLADLASVTLLGDGGSVEQYQLDLQRPDPLTAQSILRMLEQAHRTRRPVALAVSQETSIDSKREKHVMAEARNPGAAPGFIQACEWPTVPEETLEYAYAFIERLGQRYESYETGGSRALSMVKVVFTTAPGQTPEADVSDNGSFSPKTGEAWVHGDSPLLRRLEVALQGGLQVRLGLSRSAGGERGGWEGEEPHEVHEVDLVGHLGSAARPVWIEIRRCVNPVGDQSPCANTPTIQPPGCGAFDELRVSYSWKGRAYFNEGIWRLALRAPSDSVLLVDGKPTCSLECGTEPASPCCASAGEREPDESVLHHAYLNGIHNVELTLARMRCAEPFQLLVYRIR